MKKTILLGIIMLTLTGCQSLKYSLDQIFGDQREHGVFLAKDDRPASEDSLVASMDQWVKKHLW